MNCTTNVVASPSRNTASRISRQRPLPTRISESNAAPTKRSPADGGWTVLVHQVVRGLDGALLADEHVTHVYAFRDDLVHRMDIESAPQP
jgi:hypothetical protein